jgi:diguanylate cyclase (GGDEF)-like protein
MVKKRYKILAVDDLTLNSKIIREILNKEYDVVLASSGEQALDIINIDPPDLILLDIQMPGLDGYEVCKLLKDDCNTADIPVIFVTAESDTFDEAEAFELGAVDYITKPMKQPVLKARVKMHLEAKIQKDILLELANIDGLTGLANRRQFDQFLETEWQRNVRSSSGMSIIMLDVDHFKKYNDTLGHGAGDCCLKEIAIILKKSLHRCTDLVARYGGEEFAIVLTQVERGDAKYVADRILENMNKAGIIHPDSPTNKFVTLSLGCASIFPSKGVTPIPLLEAADKMLYKAKSSGRNRFELTIL